MTVLLMSFSAAELSSFIGYVPQNPSLMTGTIEENLRMGRDAFSEDDLWHALRLAQADGFVRELNDGLNSQVTRGAEIFPVAKGSVWRLLVRFLAVLELLFLMIVRVRLIMLQIWLCGVRLCQMSF